MERYLIAGLGNPGPKYAANRHSVGFRCVTQLAEAYGLVFDRAQMKAIVAHGKINERKVILAQPQTYMNASGSSVAPLARFYRVSLDRLMVVYDDLDLPLGTVRLRPEGGSGGHKGMTSIIQHLGGQQGFSRLRIGIGRPPGQMDPAAYVLRDFSLEEKPVLDDALARAVESIEIWLSEGIEVAMNRCNQRGQDAGR
jgi:PTH1 family peptidyl-tRNA hydrolase